MYEQAQKKKEEVNKQVKKWDTDQWEEEVNSKTSLKIYRISKKNIQEDPITTIHQHQLYYFKPERTHCP